MPEVLTRRVDEIVFREDLYPRLETSPATVQKYAEDLGVLPPIEVNQHNELIDGWHRWTGHKKNGVAHIQVIVRETKSDAHLLELAIEGNAIHGLQLSQADKKKMAKRIYLAAANRRERMAVKARLTRLLSVSPKLLDAWLSRAEKDLKEEAKHQVFELWLACHPQTEIAETLGWPQPTIVRWLEGIIQNPEFGILDNTLQSTPERDAATADAEEDVEDQDLPLQLSKGQLADADHATHFTPPLYNIWKQQEKSAGSKHFGNSEVRWLDNLLYLYTKLFDLVVDPFAGGGSTIDLCKKRLRRYFVSDRNPVVEREKEIRKLDLTEGLPDLRKRWQDVRLVYLDPPYWKQAEGQYSQDPTDLANMDLETFTETLAGIIKGFAKKLSEGAFIALLMQPTQWKAPERQFTDHVADMLRLIKLPVDMRISCPYESQQCTAQMVEWAKENKKVLVLTRELIVWRI